MRTASALLSVLLLLPVPGATEPIPRRSVELSGQFQFESESSDVIDTKTLVLLPGIRYYPDPNFFLGPIGEYGLSWSRGSEYSQTVLGGEAGFITAGGASHTHVYIGVGAGWLHLDFDDFVEESEDGYAFTAFLGLKFRLGGDFYLNLQPSLDWRSAGVYDRETFAIRMGFSGMLDP